ncbi:MAG: 3',5'-nucleoside bisphosphate phosphatase [Casimicrobiaceae bacterium]
MKSYDLHCHSTWSDGVLSPADVVRRAANNGVDVLALTDHDEVSGNAEARATAAEVGIKFVDGVEVSVSYLEETIHVLGLGVDSSQPALAEGLHGIRAGRDSRARRIGQSLAEAGIDGAYEGARQFAGNEQLISRAHFARFLVEQGIVRDTHSCFKRFLVRGKPGFVEHAWPSLPDAIAWIRNAGGTAVLAHPGRYRVSADEMRDLLTEFRETGGEGLEVISSAHSPEQSVQYSTMARLFNLKASVGSDFHAPGESLFDLGQAPRLPEGVTPVWSDW